MSTLFRSILILLLTAFIWAIFVLYGAAIPSLLNQPSSMYRYTASFETHDVVKYKFFNKTTYTSISYKDAILMLQKDEAFINLVIKILKNCEFKSYFFETPPVQINVYDKIQFEFVLVDAVRLNNIKSDKYAFQQYFTSDFTVSFENLGKNALLIVPCPRDMNIINQYAQLATFVREAKIDEVYSLLKLTALKMDEVVKKNKPIWLSTSGLGVYWLHMRIDTFPKYYTYFEYRNKKY